MGLLADISNEGAAGIILGVLGTLATGAAGIIIWYYTVFKPKYRESGLADVKARLEAKKLEDEETQRPYRELAEKLSNKLNQLEAQMETFRAQAETRIQAAMDHANDCEKRFAVLDERYKMQTEHNQALSDRVSTLEGKK